MAKMHGRFAPKTEDRSKDPGSDYTTPGFKVTERGPGVERLVDTGHQRRDVVLAAREDLKAQLSDPHQAVKSKVVIVNIDKATPEQIAQHHAWRKARNIKDALADQDPRAEKTTNASLHVVKTPGGVAAYHRERQATALEMAKDLKGKDRKFALALAKEHGAAKRSAQKRVPAGQATGGRWTK
jgi:hypothetical protein